MASWTAMTIFANDEIGGKGNDQGRSCGVLLMWVHCMEHTTSVLISGTQCHRVTLWWKIAGMQLEEQGIGVKAWPIGQSHMMRLKNWERGVDSQCGVFAQHGHTMIGDFDFTWVESMRAREQIEFVQIEFVHRLEGNCTHSLKQIVESNSTSVVNHH